MLSRSCNSLDKFSPLSGTLSLSIATHQHCSPFYLKGQPQYIVAGLNLKIRQDIRDVLLPELLMRVLPLEYKIRPGSTSILVFEIFSMILVCPMRRMAMLQVFQNRDGRIFNANWATV